MSCSRLPTFGRDAANEPVWMPAICDNPEFASWALRVVMRLRNLPRPSTERLMRRAMFKEFTPCPEWAEGLQFFITLGRGEHEIALALDGCYE